MSTILPLPSSPHCAPRTAMFVFDIRVYRSSERGYSSGFGVRGSRFEVRRFRVPRLVTEPTRRATEHGTANRGHERRTSNIERRTAMTIALDGHSLTLDNL